MINRTDPVLALLACDDALPRNFLGLPKSEPAWRGRLFLVSWVLYGSEPYAWALALALARNGSYSREIRRSLGAVNDRQLIRDALLMRDELPQDGVTR